MPDALPMTRPFDDIRRLVSMMPGPDEAAVLAVRERNRDLTKPPGSLGRLEWVVEWLAAWQGRPQPSVTRPLVCVFAANHGVARRGTADPAEANRWRLENFAAGGAAINQICASLDLGFKVFDLALELPTDDIVDGPAMTEKACVATMAFGMEAIAGGSDLLAIGEMGAGNSIVAAAIYTALYGGPTDRWVGRETAGADDEARVQTVSVVDAALRTHQDHLGDPLEILARLGGRDIAAMAGAILAARLQRIPVVLDGYVATAAAAILHALHPEALDHCIAGHLSAEGDHREVLERLDKIPLLALGLQLGEGTGAALAAGLVRTAAACHAGMATLEQAGVSRALGQPETLYAAS